MNKIQVMEQFGRAVQMFIQSLTNDDAMEVAMIYPKYIVGKFYKINEIFTYDKNNVNDPQLYRVLQDHTSQADWTPNTTPSLYKAIGLTDDGVAMWSQPVGASDAYNKGDVVSHNGVLWESEIEANVWEPGIYGWTQK